MTEATALNETADAALLVFTDSAAAKVSELIREDSAPRHRRAEGDAAAALYDRGLVRAYSGQFAPGLEDINRAIAMSPGHAEWESRLATLNQMVRAVGLEVPPPAAPRARRPAAGAVRRPAR